MGTLPLRKIRKWIAGIGIFTVLSSLVVIAPVASADALDDGCEWALSTGVMTSCDKGGSLTKLAFTVMLTRLVVGEDAVEDSDEQAFTDVPASHSANKYLVAAKEAGIVAGTGGCFVNGCPSTASSKTMNRCEAATMLSNAFALEDEADLSEFADSVPDWCGSPMAKAVEAGLVGGKEMGGKKYLAGTEFSNQGQGAVLSMRSNDTFDLGLVATEGEGEGEVAEGEGEVAEGEGEVAEGEGEVAGGALTFALSSTPAGGTLPTGARGVPVLQFSVSAGAATTLDSLKFTRTGVGLPADFANLYVYEGASRLKSGKTISADTNTVEFTNLALTVESGTPRVLSLKVDVAAAGVVTANDQHIFSIAAAGDVASNATSLAGLPLQSNQFTIGAAAVGAVTLAVVSAISGPTLGQSAAECGNVRITAGANDINVNAITFTHGGTISRSNLGNFKFVQPGYTAEGITDGVISTASAIGSNDRLTFVMGTPFKIVKNQNRNFEIRCDILSGKTTDNLRFYVDETSDADITDLQYNYGSNITNNIALANTTAVALQGGKVTFADNGPVAQNVARNTTNRQLFNFSISADRNITVRDFWLLVEQTAWDNTSAARAGDGDNAASGAALANNLDAGQITTAGVVTFQTDADEIADMAVNDVVRLAATTVTAGTAGTYFARITTVGANSSTADVTATLIYPATTVAATVTWADDAGGDTNAYAEVYDAHLVTRVKNIKLVDLDTGGTIASTSNSNYAMSFSDDFDLRAGQTRHLSIQTDFDNTLAATNAFQGGFDMNDAGFIRDTDANENLAAADIVAGNLFGKTMTAVAASLTVTLASTPVTETHVKGEANVDTVGFSVRAGDGGAIKVTRVNVRLFGEDGAADFGDEEGDVAANTLVTSAGLYKVDGTTYTRLTGSTTDVGLTQVGTIGAAGGYFRAQFSNLTHSIAAAATEKWVVRVNLTNTITAQRFLAVDIDPDDDITSQDQDGNAVTAGGAANINVTGTTPTVRKTIATAGSLAVTEQSSPNPAVLVAGTSNNVVTKYQWSSTNEAFTISKLDVQLAGPTADANPFDEASTSAADRSVTGVKLRYTNKDGTTVTSSAASLSSDIARFTGLTIYVPKNTTATAEVLLDLNSIASGAVTGDSLRLGISTLTGQTFEAIGEGSSTTLALANLAPSNQINVPTHVIRKSQPVVAKATTGLPTTLTNGVVKVYGFTVKADGGPVSLKRIAFTVNATFTDAGDELKEFKFFRGSTNLASDVSIFTKYGTNAETNDVSGTATSVSEVLTLTFDQAGDAANTAKEETISSGVTNTYYLEATIAGASTGNNVSINIADDTVSMAAAAGVDEFAGTASSQGNAQVWRYSRGATDDTTTLTDDFVYFDVNGSGTYTAAADYGVSAANTTEPTTAANAPADNAYLNGVLRVGADATANNNDTFYWDLNAGGTFTAASEVAIALGGVDDGVQAADTAQTFAIRCTSTTALYVDVNGGATNTNDVDYDITVDAGPACTANAEIVTSNMNFVWSDQGEASGTVHATTTSAWTNGLNVDNLATGSLSLTF